ncbi:hypothetical protein [Piscinibacter gummiphilus]|uniref:Uncharacterized protein n=1 Tax=Piscinibacter gummiphilus TaxID=946333 RepID=A0ABZ0CVK9_9BURK|nr:hypothetical protein [Piscinibacter gummiphilus]WOB06554.1 hypothetical protein RXV79_16670 [Piscinibacter gummiphilus]
MFAQQIHSMQFKSLDDMLSAVFPGIQFPPREGSGDERFIPAIGEAFYITSLEVEHPYEHLPHRLHARDDMMLVASPIQGGAEVAINNLLRIDSFRFTPMGAEVAARLGIERQVAVAQQPKA